jgi:8-oxo-dGTP pyrophosphatase MutT (NUDIX family)
MVIAMKREKTNTGIRPWLVRKSKLAFDNRWAKVRLDECELPSGEVIPDYYYWEGSDFAQVFALTPTNEVVLTRQYKHGVKEIVTELPAGLIDSDETPLAAAKRELEEETGYTAKDWVKLGELNVSSAKATTHASAFLARNAQKTAEPALDSAEDIDVFLVTIEELLDLISQGSIKDANSVAATLLALRSLERKV